MTRHMAWKVGLDFRIQFAHLLHITPDAEPNTREET